MQNGLAHQPRRRLPASHGRPGRVSPHTPSPTRRWRRPVSTRAERDVDRAGGSSRNDVQRLSRPAPGSYDTPPNFSGYSGGNYPPNKPPREVGAGASDSFSNLTKAFVAGSFILGMGAGIWFSSEVNFAPQNVASTVLVDTKTPSSEVCIANGYSSMVFDQRLFVSFNPFNVYVSQPEVKPGCVLRRANFNVLESRGLVDGQEVQNCKRNMNTFAFVGDLGGKPQVSCVYHSEEAENQFLRDPKNFEEMKVKNAGVQAGATGAGGAGGATGSSVPR
jgi:hypothetical protein